VSESPGVRPPVRSLPAPPSPRLQECPPRSDRRVRAGPSGGATQLEGANLGGIKDRPGLHMIREARRRGDLAPGTPIVESSSGTLGLGLAWPD
jgi:hypothetical protein